MVQNYVRNIPPLVGAVILRYSLTVKGMQVRVRSIHECFSVHIVLLSLNKLCVKVLNLLFYSLHQLLSKRKRVPHCLNHAFQPASHGQSVNGPRCRKDTNPITAVVLRGEGKSAFRLWICYDCGNPSTWNTFFESKCNSHFSRMLCGILGFTD